MDKATEFNQYAQTEHRIQGGCDPESINVAEPYTPWLKVGIVTLPTSENLYEGNMKSKLWSGLKAAGGMQLW